MKKRNYIFTVCMLCAFCFTACAKERPTPKNKATAAVGSTPLIPSYNIYVENSGSMDGFVKVQATKFQETVYQFLLNGVEGNNIASNISRNFIVNESIKQFNEDTNHYLKSLTPSTFHKFSDGSHSSEISVMLKSILAKSTDKNVIVWVSDCDFYPGDKIPANKYLKMQKIEINSIFKKITNKGNYSTVVLQLMSDYDGIYYGRHINQDRPYYIWIVGKTQYIETLFDKVPLNSFEGGGVKGFYCLTDSKTPVKHIILGASNYKLATSNPKHEIVDAESIQAGPNKGKFQFSIGLNLKGSLLGVDDSYVLDASNYSVTSISNYTIEVKRNTGKGNYTHVLKLTAPKLKVDNVKITLLNRIPKWVDLINSTQSGPLTENTKFKTFGIKTLIEGVKEAYGNQPFFETNISVN